MISIRRRILLAVPILAVLVAILWFTGLYRHVLSIDAFRDDDQGSGRWRMFNRLVNQVSAANEGFSPSPQTLLVSCNLSFVRYTLYSETAKSKDDAGRMLKQIVGGLDNWDISTYDHNGYYSATARCKAGWKGVSGASVDYDLSGISDRCLAQPGTGVLVTIPSDAKAEPQYLSKIASIDGRDLYLNSLGRPTAIRLTGAWSFGQLFKAWYVCLFFLWVVLLYPAACLLVQRLLRNSARRRAVYSAVVYPLFILMVVAALLLRDPRNISIFSAYFNTSTQRNLFVLSVIFWPFAIWWGNMAVQEPEAHPNFGKMLSRYLYYERRYWFLGLMIGALVSAMISPTMRGQAALFVLMGGFPTMFGSRLKFSKSSDPLLEAEVEKAASHFGIQFQSIHLIESAQLSKMVNALAIKKGYILMTPKAYLDLTLAETRFIIGHECAHLKRMQSAPAPKVWPQLVLPATFLTLLSLMLSYLSWLAMGVLCCSLIAWIIIRFAKHTHPNQAVELACDAESLQYTKDLPAALSALEKLRRPTKKNKKEKPDNSSTHPTIDQRIEHLRNEAGRLGIAEIESADILRSSSLSSPS